MIKVVEENKLAYINDLINWNFDFYKIGNLYAQTKVVKRT